MLSQELKLRFVKHTISTLEEMAKEHRENSAYWYKNGFSELGNYYEGKASAYEIAVEFLKADLKD